MQKKVTLTKEALIHARDLDYIGKRTFLGNYSLTEEEFSKLKKASRPRLYDGRGELPPERRTFHRQEGSCSLGSKVSRALV